MNDGWDDDELDLDITLDNTGHDHIEDDNTDLKDEEVISDDGHGDHTGATDDKPTVGQLDGGEGWRDDDVDLNFDDSWGDAGVQQQQQKRAEASAPSAILPSTHQPRVPSPSGAPESASAPDAIKPVSSADGWGDDDDLFGEEDGEEPAADLPTSPPPPPPKKGLLQELKDYVSSLSRMESSINAVLEYEYNTLEKAQELMQYYVERPGLAEYTRTKEVPRMNYHVILPNGKVETDKNKIAQLHLPDHSLMSRCANQSLLADLLHVLTGPDLVVRPQFLAVCVAQNCQFRLHVGDQGRDMLQCNCMLQLSLPVADGPRLNIATVRTTVVFSPNQPMVRFKVEKIVVMLKEQHYYKLERVVEFLKMMEGHFNELPGHEDAALQNAPADIFRDAFLEQSQQLVTQSTAGMKSALKDMESVIGLKSKFNAVRGGISKFLPDTNVLLEAEKEAQTLAAQRAQQQSQHLPRPPAQQVSPGRPPVQSMAGHPHHHHPPPHRVLPPAPPSGEGSARPKSILSGLMSSGWSALAKSVTIPDDDPAIYGPASRPPQQQQQRPMLYNKPDQTVRSALDGESATTLYRNDAQPFATQPVRPLPGEAPLPFHRNEKPPAPPLISAVKGFSGAPAEPASQLVQVPEKGPQLVRPPPPLPLPQETEIESTKEFMKEEPLPEQESTNEQDADMTFGDGWDDDLEIDEAEINGDASCGEERAKGELLIEEDESSTGATSAEEAIEQELEDQLVRSPAVSSFVPLEATTEEPVSETTKVPPPSRPWEHAPRPIVKTTRAPLRRPDIPYDAQDDIIPTRKRWVNPRPNRSYLYQ